MSSIIEIIDASFHTMAIIKSLKASIFRLKRAIFSVYLELTVPEKLH